MADQQDRKQQETGTVRGLSNGPGAADNDAGGGNASGTPSAEVGMRTDAADKGDVQEDKKKLFPEATKQDPR